MSEATAPRDRGHKGKGGAYTPILGGFIPLAALWDERADNGPLFPSEGSARWFVHSNRAALVAAEAIAIHARQMLIHPERFANVAQRIAVERAA